MKTGSPHTMRLDVFAEGQFDDIPSKRRKCDTDVGTGETENGEPSEKMVYPIYLPISMELGVPPEDLSKCEQVLEKKAKGTVVISQAYYFCSYCTYKNRNRTTAVTHIHKDQLQISSAAPSSFTQHVLLLLARSMCWPSIMRRWRRALSQGKRP